MSFSTSFEVGSTHSNADIVAEFKCGNMGGMRRSNKTKTLVIISDYTKGLYDDKWVGDTLHYTGMGKSGHQDINFSQNRTLNESNTNEVEVHLFEVLKAGKYIYKGPVTLCENKKPYKSIQKGEDGIPREVWIFPLRLKSGDIPIDKELIKDYEETKRLKAQKLKLSELKQRAENSQSDLVSSRTVKSITYIRDPYVSEYAKHLANGECQLCNQKAPFQDKKGNPYLETHHIDWLSRGGSDTIENTVALCPNCHKKMHVVDSKEDIKKLKDVVKSINFSSDRS